MSKGIERFEAYYHKCADGKERVEKISIECNKFGSRKEAFMHAMAEAYDRCGEDETLERVEIM